jgi:HK97 family phage portal protein
MMLFSRDFWWPVGPSKQARQEARAGGIENPSVPMSAGSILAAVGNDADGQLVTPVTAMGTSAIYACVSAIADIKAMLPWNLMERQPDGTVRVAADRPLHHVLHFKPNAYQTSVIFRQMGQAQALLWGNFYAEIQRDRRTGETIGLWPIPAWLVTPELENGIKRFRVNGMLFADEDIFHVPAFGWDGVKGISPIALHRRSIGLSLSAEAFGENFYRNGTKLAGALRHPQQLSAEAQARLRQSWHEAYSGAANAGRVAILEEGMDFTPFTMPLEDAQFVETRKFQIADAARIYRMPLHMVGEMEGAKFNNIEQQNIDFVQKCLLPWIVRWEQEAQAKLLTETERRTLFTKINVAGLLRGDMKSRFEAYALGRQWGWQSVNDILELEDKNGIGPSGDIYLQPLNMVQAGSAPESENGDRDGN